MSEAKDSAIGPAAEEPESINLRDVDAEDFKRGIGYLVLFGLLLRLAYFFDHGTSPYFGVPLLDQIYYDMVARLLTEGGELSQLQGFRPLLYPMFLSVFYRIGGSMGFEFSLVAQHGLGIATGVLVALIGARLFRNRACGLVGGFLYLLAGPPLYFEGELLITSSYTFLITLTLLVHLHAAEAPRERAWWLWIVCGALTALTAQARANMLIFLGIFPLFALWRWRSRRQATEFTPMIGWAGALAMMVVWGFVHIPQTGQFQLIPSQGGLNLYLGNHRNADGMIPEQEWAVSYDGDAYRDSLAVFAEQEFQRVTGQDPAKNPMDVSHYWTKKGLNEIKADPARWLGLMAKKSWMIFWNVEIPNNNAYEFIVNEESTLLRWMPVRWFVLLALFPLGIMALRERDAGDRLFILAGYIILYTAGLVGFFVCSRYRIPLWPAMSVFAGGGALYLERQIRRREQPGLKISAAIVIGAMALSLINWFGAQVPSFARDYFFRSIAHYTQGNYDAALSDIDQSLRITTHDISAVVHRGNVLFALQRIDEAKTAYELALKTVPDETTVLNNLGAANEHLEDYAAAYRTYQEGLKQKPYNNRMVINLAMLQLRAGLLIDAGKTLNLLDPRVLEKDLLAICAQADLARRRGNQEAANRLATQALAADEPTATEMLNRLASPLTPADLGL